jgi:polyhydroxyalkanoate synthesis regulator phasin
VQEVDEKRQKAIKKVVEKEEKLRAPVQKKAAQNPNYIANLESSIEDLRKTVENLNARLA